MISDRQDRASSVSILADNGRVRLEVEGGIDSGGGATISRRRRRQMLPARPGLSLPPTDHTTPPPAPSLPPVSFVAVERSVEAGRDTAVANGRIGCFIATSFDAPEEISSYGVAIWYEHVYGDRGKELLMTATDHC